MLDLSPDDDSALVNIAICKVIEGDTEGALVDLNNAGLHWQYVHMYCTYTYKRTCTCHIKVALLTLENEPEQVQAMSYIYSEV